MPEIRHRMFIDSPSFFIRPNNTDWIYTRKFLPQLVNYIENFQVITRSSLLLDTLDSVAYLSARLNLKGIKHSVDKISDRNLPSVFRKTQANVYYSHSSIPFKSHFSELTIIQSSVLDPVMTQFWANFRNCSYDEDKAYEEFVEVVGQASKIIVSTHAERKRIVNVVPSLGERVVSIPFFQPYLREFVSPEEIRMKHQTNRIGIMFVGRESDRKGYDLFQSAISNLTRFDGVSVSIFGQSTTTLNSKNLNIEFFPKGDRALVLSEMRRNHILFHPARFESYGFVITEAMANGMAVIAPAWEVQSELLDYGSAGELVFPQIFDCFHALERMISDSETRTVLALRAYYRWEEKYHPGVVADAWKTMLNNL